MNTTSLTYCHLATFRPDAEIASTFADITDALAAVRESLAHLAPSPTSRAWLVQARVYVRTVRNWDIYPPSVRQARAMRDCVTDLLAGIWSRQ